MPPEFREIIMDDATIIIAVMAFGLWLLKLIAQHFAE